MAYHGGQEAILSKRDEHCCPGRGWPPHPSLSWISIPLRLQQPLPPRPLPPVWPIIPVRQLLPVWPPHLAVPDQDPNLWSLWKRACYAPSLLPCAGLQSWWMVHPPSNALCEL